MIGLVVALAAGPAYPAAGSGCLETNCGATRAEFTRWQNAERLKYGYGMTGRAEQAIHWYRREANGADPRAMYNLGIMLDFGMGTEPDPIEARRWLTEALLSGIAEAAFALGNMAREGRGAEPDPTRAAAYYRTAAGTGMSRAMHALGNLHAAGTGVPDSKSEAYFWYHLSAERGHLLSVEARDLLRAILPEAERARIEARAKAWEETDRD